MNKHTKIHLVIHSTSIVAAGLSGTLAQVPGGDYAPLGKLHTAMIVAIARSHGVQLSRDAALRIALAYAGKLALHGLASALAGWFPGLGNAASAASAALLTEALGWSVHAALVAGRHVLAGPAHSHPTS